MFYNKQDTIKGYIGAYPLPFADDVDFLPFHRDGGIQADDAIVKAVSDGESCSNSDNLLISNVWVSSAGILEKNNSISCQAEVELLGCCEWSLDSK